MKRLFAFCIALMLATLPMGAAMAETIIIYGTVVNTQPQSVLCTADSTLEQVNVAVGDGLLLVMSLQRLQPRRFTLQQMVQYTSLARRVTRLRTLLQNTVPLPILHLLHPIPLLPLLLIATGLLSA